MLGTSGCGDVDVQWISPGVEEALVERCRLGQLMTNDPLTLCKMANTSCTARTRSELFFVCLFLHYCPWHWLHPPVLLSRRETFQVRVWWMWQKIRQQQRPEEALSRPHQRQALLLQGPWLWQILHAPELAAEAHESALQIPATPFHQRHLHLIHEPSGRPPVARLRPAQEPLHEPLPPSHQPKRVVRVSGERGAQPPAHPLEWRAHVRFRRWGLFQKLGPQDNALMACLQARQNLSPTWPLECVVPCWAACSGYWSVLSTVLLFNDCAKRR